MAVSKYNKKFEEDILFFINKTNKNITEVKRLAVFDLFSNVVDDTPLYIIGSKVRGQVKWNWTISIGSLTSSPLVGLDPEGSKTKERGYAQLKKITDADEDIYIANSHEAIFKLEYGQYDPPESARVSGGFSTQAPSGMLRKNAIQWNVMIPNAIKQINT